MRINEDVMRVDQRHHQAKRSVGIIRREKLENVSNRPGTVPRNIACIVAANSSAKTCWLRQRSACIRGVPPGETISRLERPVVCDYVADILRTISREGCDKRGRQMPLALIDDLVAGGPEDRGEIRQRRIQRGRSECRAIYGSVGAGEKRAATRRTLASI